MHTQSFTSPSTMNRMAAPQSGNLAWLFDSYQSELMAKQIDSATQLQNILYWDFAKTLHALLEIQSVDVEKVLLNFFAGQASAVPEVLASVTDRRLNHLGFEIYAPLDLLRNEFDPWLAQLSLLLGEPVKVVKSLRFPASPAFRQRVGAVAEIMSIWAKVGNRLLMLELFDIAHPLDSVLPGAATESVDLLSAAEHAPAMASLFQNDKIWHYAIHVSNRHSVELLHESFKSLTASHPQYKLAYASPVQNRHDGSFHTKIINLHQNLELEFATHERLRGDSTASIQ